MIPGITTGKLSNHSNEFLSEPGATIQTGMRIHGIRVGWVKMNDQLTVFFVSKSVNCKAGDSDPDGTSIMMVKDEGRLFSLLDLSSY